MINIQHLQNNCTISSNDKIKTNCQKQNLASKPDVVELSFKGTLPKKNPIEKIMIKARDAILAKNNVSHLQNLDLVKTNFINKRINPTMGSNSDLMLTTTSTKNIGTLDKTLNLFEAPKDMILWRAFSINDYGSDTSNVNKFIKKFFYPNRQTRMPVYMSTSFDRKVSERFLKDNTNQVLAKLEVPKGTKCVSMEGLTPGDAFHYGNEQEVLFPRNTFLKWTSVEKENIKGKEYTIINAKVSTPKGFNSNIEEYIPPEPKVKINPKSTLEDLFNSF